MFLCILVLYHYKQHYRWFTKLASTRWRASHTSWRHRNMMQNIAKHGQVECWCSGYFKSVSFSQICPDALVQSMPSKSSPACCGFICIVYISIHHDHNTHTESHSNCIYNTGCVPHEPLPICICCMLYYIQTNIASRAPATPNFYRCFSPKSKAKPSEKTSCSWSSSMLWAGQKGERLLSRANDSQCTTPWQYTATFSIKSWLRDGKLLLSVIRSMSWPSLVDDVDDVDEL